MKKLISLMMVIAMCFAMLSICHNISCAEENEEQYQLIISQNLSSGNTYTCIEGTEFSGVGYLLYNGDIETSIPVSYEDITYTISDPSVIKYENNCITAIAPGKSTFTASYKYEGKEYTTEPMEITVADYYFTNNEEIVLVNKHSINLDNENKSENIKLEIQKYSSMDENISNYYSVEWDVQDPDIASIEEVETQQNEGYMEIKVNGLKSGSTYVIATVSTLADGNAAAESVRIRIKVNVDLTEEEKKDDDKELDNSSSKEDNKPSSSEETKTDNTVAPKKLSQTGEKVTLLFAIGVFVVATCIARIKLKR